MPADTTNEPPATAPAMPTGAEPSRAAVLRELRELEGRFPAPDHDEFIADARWFQSHVGTPDFEPYRGTHIAVLNGAIVGHGWDPDQLQLDVARKYNVHPRRVLVEYLWPSIFG